MSADVTTGVVDWLLAGDVAIRYQTRRDLLGEDATSEDMQALRARILTEGWGARFLAARHAEGHWGRGFYQPKWTSSNYSLLDLKSLCPPRDNPLIRESIHQIALNEKSEDGGVNPARTIPQSDVCVNGMFLSYACYFGEPVESLVSVVDFVLDQQMEDGGFNCEKNRHGARHSSMHSTIQLLEGIHEYDAAGYTYRVDELKAAARASREFLLRHRLFRSDRTGETIHRDFLRLSFPPRWKYSVLRALDHFRAAGVPWHDRMSDALEVVVSRRRRDGRWPLQAPWPGQVHFPMEEAGRPSRWNTLIALRILKTYGASAELDRVPGCSATSESNTLALFQFALLRATKTLWASHDWYASWASRPVKSTVSATSKARSFTSRAQSSARVPAANERIPSIGLR